MDDEFESRIYIAVVLLVLLIFGMCCIFLALRDHQAVERCHHLGGVTDDSGEHCYLVHDRGSVINTR